MNIHKHGEHKIIDVNDDFIMLADEANNWFDVNMNILENSMHILSVAHVIHDKDPANQE